jgi:hypothetical protein
MAVTAHMMPYAIQQINEKAINLTTDTFKCALMVSGISTWGATQEAYQFVSSFTGAYTEVSSGGYARVSLTTLTCSYSGEVVTWTCTAPSPISWGSSITLSAASMIIQDYTVSATDSSSPVICAIDFGGTVSSTAGSWTYTVSGSGLATWTAS